MDDDLLDARAAVCWSVSQLPVLEGKVERWQQESLEVAAKDADPETGKQTWVLREKTPLPLIVGAEAGVIINSLRSALDLLAAALATRNGVPPSADTHFPIFTSLQAAIDPASGLESKKWLSKAERLAIKSLKPYNGGHETLWHLHQLDILRKHQRLITTISRILNLHVGGWGLTEDRVKLLGTRSAKNETVLCELPAGASKPHVEAVMQVVFTEPTLDVAGKEVVATLRDFARSITDVIDLFDRS